MIFNRKNTKKETIILFIIIYGLILLIFSIKPKRFKIKIKKNNETKVIKSIQDDSKQKFDQLKKLCKPDVLNYLNEKGKNFKIDIDTDPHSFDFIEEFLKNKTESQLELGGKWSPKDCVSEFKIAIIIPYRDRLINMKLFLKNMHPFFMRQNINYGIYFIEPFEKLAFNRGALMNAGFIESLNDSKNLWNCFFFHDVDMIAIDERNIYKCDQNYPIHYAVSLSKFNYNQLKDYLQKYYGGINAFTKAQYKMINGFSNLYYGWGGEDDDLRERTLNIFSKYEIQSTEIARYDTMSHKRQQMNKNRWKILKNQINAYKSNGISEGVNTTKYKLKEIRKTYLFTHILIDYPEG